MPCYEFVCRLACACIGITTTRTGSTINCNISNSGKRVPKSTHLLDTFAVDMSKTNLERVFEAKNGGIITVVNYNAVGGIGPREPTNIKRIRTVETL